MSVVACRVHDGTIEFAADSITVRGYTQSKKAAKLSRVQDDLIIGGCGTAEMTAMFQGWAKTRKPSAPTVDGIVTYVSEFYSWYRSETRDASRSVDDNAFLIGFDGHAFYVEGYYVKEIEAFDAIGAGMDYALAALHLGTTAMKACETAIELSIYCEGPVQALAMKRRGGE